MADHVKMEDHVKMADHVKTWADLALLNVFVYYWNEKL